MNTKQKRKAAKQYIRNKNKHKARKEALMHRQRREDEYKENHENIIRVLPKGTPLHLLYHGTKEYAMKLRDNRHTQPTARLILAQEYNNERVFVHAWVAGIRTFKDKKANQSVTRILLNRPHIHRLNYNKVEKGRAFDSHVWIDIKDIQSSDRLNTLYMNIGDMVAFTATTYEYRGRIEHGQIGTKFGLTSIQDVLSGYPHIDPIGDSLRIEKIEHNYPRHSEWILKWKSPTDYKTQPAPDWLGDMENYKGFIPSEI